MQHSKLTPVLLGITGLANAGKDTLAQLLATHCGARTMAFSDGIYAEVAEAFDCTITDLALRNTKEQPQPWLALVHCRDVAFVQRMQDHCAAQGHALDLMAPRSPRTILEWWGTEYRRHQNPAYWVNTVRQRIQRLRSVGCKMPIVISDVRKPDEAAMLRELGGHLWRITRPGSEVQTAHATSTTGQEFAPDLTLINCHDIAHLQGLALVHWGELVQKAHTNKPRHRVVEAASSDSIGEQLH